MADFNSLPDYNASSPLGLPKYKIIYHVNNDEVSTFDSFPMDTQVYATGEIAIIQGYTPVRFSDDGIWAYEFAGWTLAKGYSEPVAHVSGDEYIVTNHDLVLYAQWTKIATIFVDYEGTLSVKSSYRDSISSMIIPEYFGGSRIKSIGTNAFFNASIDTIVLPMNIEHVKYHAFNGWTGTTLRFIDGEVTTKYPGLKLFAGCFANTPNLTSIILPYRWREATGNLFPEQADKSDTLNIYIRNTKDYIGTMLGLDEDAGDDIETYIADPENLDMNYSRNIYWGYND